MTRDTHLAVLAASVLVAAGCRGGETSPPSGAEPSSPAPAEGAGGAAKGGEPPDGDKRVYWNQVAGRFYPGTEQELREAVAGYMEEADPPPPELAGRDLLGFTAPHAGYAYSGPVAAHGYRLLEGREVGTVIVLGFSHKGRAHRSAVLDYDEYRTPMGTLPIDGRMVETLLERGGDTLTTSQAPFAGEHSLETQLPFIARAAPGARIVPIMVGHPEGRVDEDLVDLLHEVAGDREDVVVVASTDLSHYEPYAAAREKDLETMEMMASLDWDAIASDGPQAGRMCGFFTVGVLMALADRHEGARGTSIEYLNSGDTAGDKSAGVVGYGVVAFTLPEDVRQEAGPDAGDGGDGEGLASALDDDHGRALLSIAREAAMSAVRGEPYDPPEPQDETLARHGGVFVVVRVDGRVQGTAGSLVPSGPLHEAAARAAIEAVIADERFPSPGQGDVEDMTVDVIVVGPTWSLAPEEELERFLDGTRPADGVHVKAGGLASFVHAAEGPGGELDAAALLAQACRRVGLRPTCHKPRKTDEVQPELTAFTGWMFSGHEDLADELAEAP